MASALPASAAGLLLIPPLGLSHVQEGPRGWQESGPSTPPPSPHPDGILARSPGGSQSGCCSTRRTQEGPSWCERARPRKVGGLPWAAGTELLRVVWAGAAERIGAGYAGRVAGENPPDGEELGMRQGAGQGSVWEEY